MPRRFCTCCARRSRMAHPVGPICHRGAVELSRRRRRATRRQLLPARTELSARPRGRGGARAHDRGDHAGARLARLGWRARWADRTRARLCAEGYEATAPLLARLGAPPVSRGRAVRSNVAGRWAWRSRGRRRRCRLDSGARRHGRSPIGGGARPRCGRAPAGWRQGEAARRDRTGTGQARKAWVSSRRAPAAVVDGERERLERLWAELEAL